jgi:hypothetical protein
MYVGRLNRRSLESGPGVQAQVPYWHHNGGNMHLPFVEDMDTSFAPNIPLINMFSCYASCWYDHYVTKDPEIAFLLHIVRFFWSRPTDT